MEEKVYIKEKVDSDSCMGCAIDRGSKVCFAKTCVENGEGERPIFYIYKEKPTLQEHDMEEVKTTDNLQALKEKAELERTESVAFWENYAEQAESFALFEGIEYCHLAFFEELGELCGVFAKSIRGDGPVDDTNVLKEIGDVLWNIAVVIIREVPERLHRLGDYEDPYKMLYPEVPTIDLCQRLFDLEDNFKEFLMTLNLIAKRHGGDLKVCAEMNLEKLASRKERGQLRGSGDNR